MIKKMFSIIICFLFFASPLASSSNALEPLLFIPTNESFEPDQLIVQFHPEVNLSRFSLQTGIGSLDRSLSQLNVLSAACLNNFDQSYVLKLSKNFDIISAVDKLNADPAVIYAEPDYHAKLAELPDDPYFDEQWGLEKIQAEVAWDVTLGSPNIVIAFIDSGIDLDHEDLAPNLWINPGEIPSNSLDDDNNGFIDDVQGWNFVNASNNVTDVSGHGTMVAGIAAARTNNTLGVAGVCGNCRIMPVKVTQDTGVINYSDIASGIYYAVGKGAKVINLSLGGYSDSIAIRNAINYALSKNVSIVAGAGNDHTDTLFFPAAYEGVIAVAGTDPADFKTASSNFGNWVSISAPADSIYSTNLGDGYSTDSGTSYAAPFVSGGAGLLLSLHPDWTPAMVNAQLIQTADDLDTLNPSYAGLLGSGRLNLATAMQPPSPILKYEGYIGNDVPDFQPEFGSTVNLQVNLSNEWADALDVTGLLSSADPYISITSSSSSFGDILAGQSATNSIPFVFSIDVEAGFSHSIPFGLDLTANNGAYTAHLEFNITTRSSEFSVSGTLLENTTWTSDKIYKVIADVGVPPGLTLTIEPGTRVQFAGNFSLNVGGTLVAQGTTISPIRFEPYSSEVTWNRIYFNDTGLDAQASLDGEYLTGNILKNVTIQGAANGIGCNNATPYLQHVNTFNAGMSCTLGETSLWLLDSTLTGPISVGQSDSKPNHFQNVHVTGGNTVIPWAEVEDSTFVNLTISGNAKVLSSEFSNLNISGNGIVENVTSRGSISVASGQISDSQVINGKITCSNTCAILRNNLESPQDSSITAGAGSTIAFNRVVGSQGTAIVATSGVIENNLVARSVGDGVRTGVTNIQNNTLTAIGGRALFLTGIPTIFQGNNFEFNTGLFDVYLDSTLTSPGEIQSSNNWWGTTDTNLIRQRTWDYYDDYTLAKLVTDPPLSSPSQTAPAYVRSVTLDPPSPVGIQNVDFTVEFSRHMDTSITPNIIASTGDKWENYPSMPTPRFGLGVATGENGKIYAIGGASSNGVFSVNEEYDPSTNTWTTRAPMPTPRYYLGVVSGNNGKIYAIGGVSISEILSNVVEEYDPVTDTWKSCAPMPTRRASLAVATANNGRIYAIGGEIVYPPIFPKITDVVEEYDPITNTWVTRAPMLAGMRHFGATSSTNGKIYAVGGSLVEEYDPVTNIWTFRSPMLSPRYRLGVVSADNGNIYTFGGTLDSSGGTPTNYVEEFNPTTNSWVNLSLMLTPRSELGAAVFSGNRIYTIGGRTIVSQYSNINDEFLIPIFQNIILSPTWLDSSHFRSSYDFSVMSIRGEYRMNITSALGSDGIEIAPFNSTTFIFDYAGEISDTTPPPLPIVTAWGDGSLTQLYAHALVNDLESDVVAYRYAIGTSPGGTDVINWTDTIDAEIIHTGLSLLQDQAYYVSVIARNVGGLWSSVGISNPVVNGMSFNYIFLPVITR